MLSLERARSKKSSLPELDFFGGYRVVRRNSQGENVQSRGYLKSQEFFQLILDLCIFLLRGGRDSRQQKQQGRAEAQARNRWLILCLIYVTSIWFICEVRFRSRGKSSNRANKTNLQDTKTRRTEETQSLARRRPDPYTHCY